MFGSAHPLPDENNILAVEAIKIVLKNVQKDDIIICLLSGGASSLWDVPPGISLKEIQIVYQLLLNCGANILEMNTIRKHISSIKGGQLLRCAPTARWFNFIISDVSGNQLEIIASGPTVADPSTFKDAVEVIIKYSLQKKCHMA